MTHHPSQTRVAFQVMFGVAAVALGLWLVYRLASVLLILVLSTVFAYVIAPLVRVVSRPIRIAGRPRALPRAAAIGFVYVLVAVAIWIGVSLLLPILTAQMEDVAAKTPAYTRSIVAWGDGLTRYYQRVRIPAELRKAIDRSASDGIETVTTWARNGLLSVVGALAYAPLFVLIPILAFLLLNEAPHLLPRVVDVVPDRQRDRTLHLIEDLNAALAAFIRAQLVACALVGTICGIIFAVLAVPYAVLLGVLAGVLEFIPLVGPVVVAVVAGIVAALHGPGLALWVLGALGVFRVVHDYVIYPRLVGHTLALHPFVVVMAVLAGAELGGIAGLFLAVPVAAMLSVVVRHWLTWNRGGAHAASS
jgi:predicted PurR-regulated permease PerM